jgi:protein involved in polysaccharide export with SLBB domain
MKYETRNAQKVLVGAMIYLVIGLAPVAAQTRQQPQVKVPNSISSGEPSNTPTIIVSADQDYRIGPRDVIEVRIEDASELSDTYQINADGGNSILKAFGMGAAQRGVIPF